MVVGSSPVAVTYLMKKDISVNVKINFVKGNCYRIHFRYINKEEAINLFKKNADLIKIMDLDKI